ncbi:MAG TPA: TolC family protein [Thermoanaerobaculaceae bacterium]|nr:TolC family protein [Thermoanaerobaculaceae bacterium]HRS17498.1 TolC family protein [Thermoanaerobaculaceae bacterium]
MTRNGRRGTTGIGAFRGFVAAGIVAVAVPAARGQEIDLDSAIHMALESNQAFQAVVEKRVEVQSAIAEARADAFPQLSLYAGWNQSRNPSFLNSRDFEDILNQFPGADFSPRAQDLYATGLRLSQPLFTFGKIGAAVQLARLAASATEAQVEVARLDTALAAAEAYYGLLAAREQVRTLELEQQSRAEALAVVQARFDIGEATRLELLQAQAALAEVSPTVEGARGGLLVAETRLRAVLGLWAGASLTVRPVEGDPPAPPDSGILARAGWVRRPELAALELEREARRRQERVITADGLPRIDLSGSWGRQVRLLENLDRSLFDDWRVSVDLSWSLFDGGRRRGQAAAVRSVQRQLELRLADTENRVALEVEQAVTGYRTALARLEAARQARDAAREARRVAEETYQLGAAIFADVLDAQRREVQAEVNAVASYFEAWVGAARLARAVGRVPGVAWDGNGWKQE